MCPDKLLVLVSYNLEKKRSTTLLKKRLWHRCFPVNFAKFLRTTPVAASVTALSVNDTYWSLLPHCAPSFGRTFFMDDPFLVCMFVCLYEKWLNE